MQRASCGWVAREISRQKNRKNRSRHHQSSHPLSTESSEPEEDEAADEKPVVTTRRAKSNCQRLHRKRRQQQHRRSRVPLRLRAKTTPKPIPKPTPKKTLLAKASQNRRKTQAEPAKANAEVGEKRQNTLAKKDSASGAEACKADQQAKLPVRAAEAVTSEFGWYGNMLHDRFYSAWIQPTTNVPSGTKISTLVNVRIEKDGHVSKFEIVKPSENVTVNESVAAVAKRVTEVDPPPTGLIKGDHYDVKINFELNTEQGVSK